MRAFCTVSAPLEVCASSAEQLSPGSRFLALKLLGNQQPKTLYFLVDAKSRVREVYTQTCLHFATQGMLDTELFGLAVLIDGEYLFADLESKLSKYGPKSWRSSHTHGLDANGRPLLELHFRVQFYIESPFILKDETSRHNYFLQLKYNALQRDIPKEYSEQSMILLGSLALQADLGDAPAVETSTIKTTTSNSTKTKSPTTKVVEDGASSRDCGSKDDVSPASGAKVSTTCFVSTTAAAAATSTTTLPKISRKIISTNENMPRLSTYIASNNQSTSSSLTKSTSGTSSSVFPIGGSLKRSLGSMAATLSPSSPSLSINRGIASVATPATITFSTATSTTIGIQTGYFRLEDYLPVGLHSAWAVGSLRAHHRENQGMSTADAELHYIRQASIVHESINAHTFRMRLSKSENGPGRSWFIVYAKGIKIFGTNDNPQQQVTTFLWPNITKLSFERKKFEIRSGDSKITLYATSDDKNKMLLTLCKETHQFSMKIAARLKEVIKREEEESNCLHACYTYSRSLHLPYKNKNDQRISVISSTSSNTTSGIVSDRVHSEDELEIMINTPPVSIAAPSTESLALAHLLDRPSVSRQTSSVGQVSLKDLEDQLAALSVRQAQKHLSCNSGGSETPPELSNASGNSSASDSNPTCSQRTLDSSTTTDSPSSQHNIGSQCSSTCSTVVVASALESTTNALASLTVHTNTNSTPTQRRISTSSSLELGFSHTAQNSTLSEGESFVPSTRDDNESISGVYTLAQCVPPTETSGVYTMHSSEMTGQSSEIAESEKSSHYGIFQPTKNEVSEHHLRAPHPNLDSVDGGNYHGKRIKNEEFRLRSDSNVSTSDSFRGDGSDPTDNKHTLLSAEELTDLIVGRGTYPNRKTVSSTLDSDCDYVTLPLPMEGESYIQGHQDTAPTEDHVDDLMNDLLATDPPAPPKRMDSNELNHKNLATLSNIRMRSPPPYNAPHEKTGVSGPPIRSSLPAKPIVSTTTSSNVPSTVITIETKTVPKATAPTSSSSSAIRRRDPPPYPSSVRPRPTSLINHSSNTLSAGERSTTTYKSEEATARFITTRPQISILKAHTSIVNENHRPSYAAPTNYSSAASSTGSVCSHHISNHSVHNSNYAGGSQTSLSMNPHSRATTSPMSTAAVTHVTTAAVGVGVIPTTIGIPIVPYSLHGTHKSMVSDMKSQPAHTCVLLPVIKPRQFLPPPPPNLPRQPPPPPPAQLAGVYTSQLARKQLELYQQQLYSDVDYVIYPIRDPAVSQQEYLDAKQGSILAAMAQTPQPHPYLAYHTSSAHTGGWDTCKGHAIYRSTPYLPLSLSAHSRYASTQNLSDTYVQLPSAYSPLYSPSMASLCTSFEPPPPPPLHPALVAAAANASNLFARSRSDDNILNSLDSLPKMKRLPPPPPPPYVNRRLKKPPMPAPTEKPPPIPSKPSSTLSHCIVSSTTNQMQTRSHQFIPQTLNTTGHNMSQMTKTSSGAQWAGERPRPEGIGLNHGSSSILEHLQASVAAANRGSTNSTKNLIKTNTSLTCSGSTGSTNTTAATANALDIALLREKSKHLDLPLISALCNDRSLLKQTKILVNPKHSRAPSNKLNSSTVKSTAPALPSPMPTSVTSCHTSSKSLATISSTTVTANQNSSNIITANTSSTTIPSAQLSAGKTRKSSISHRHPNDKLPPLPMQFAEANNYVMDPAILRHHKSCNSQI